MNILKKLEQTQIIIILVIINILIKGIYLPSNSLGGDEPFSVYHAQMNIPSIIKLLSVGNNPPLYEIILNLWIKLFGITELSVRFPSLIFSSITVLFIYKLGSKYLNNRIAIYSSIIFIFSNYHILFAHEARVYSLIGMLSVISMYYFMGIIQYCITDNNLKLNVRKKLIMLIISNILLIYSHYFGFFILITQFIFFIFNKNLITNYWKQLIISIIIMISLYLPNIYVLLNRFIESSLNGTWVPQPNGIKSIYNMIRVLTNAPVVAVCIITLLIASIVKSIINNKIEKISIYNRLITFWFVFIYFFMFGISYLIPMFLDRYLMPAAISFPILIGISADYIIKTPKYKYIIPIVISLLFVTTVKPNISNKRNVKETVEQIKELKNKNTITYLCPSWFELSFVYYYDIECFKNFDTKDIKVNIYNCLHKENIYPIDSHSLIDLDYIQKFDKIIFLDAAADFSFPQNGILQKLKENYKLKNEYFFQEIFKIYEFEHN